MFTIDSASLSYLVEGGGGVIKPQRVRCTVASLSYLVWSVPSLKYVEHWTIIKLLSEESTLSYGNPGTAVLWHDPHSESGKYECWTTSCVIYEDFEYSLIIIVIKNIMACNYFWIYILKEKVFYIIINIVCSIETISRSIWTLQFSFLACEIYVILIKHF